jgi:hypothetical protein
MQYARVDCDTFGALRWTSDGHKINQEKQGDKPKFRAVAHEQRCLGFDIWSLKKRWRDCADLLAWRKNVKFFSGL